MLLKILCRGTWNLSLILLYNLQTHRAFVNALSFEFFFLYMFQVVHHHSLNIQCKFVVINQVWLLPWLSKLSLTDHD